MITLRRRGCVRWAHLKNIVWYVCPVCPNCKQSKLDLRSLPQHCPHCGDVCKKGFKNLKDVKAGAFAKASWRKRAAPAKLQRPASAKPIAAAQSGHVPFILAQQRKGNDKRCKSMWKRWSSKTMGGARTAHLWERSCSDSCCDLGAKKNGFAYVRQLDERSP